MLSLRSLLAIALSTLITSVVAPTAQAADRKPADSRKSSDADRSAGLRIVDAAKDAGTAFSRDRDKCDDDKDNDKDRFGGVKKTSSNKHKRPDCDDDDDDDDDCDGHGGHDGHGDHGNHGNHNGHDHKKPKDCHPSPSR